MYELTLDQTQQIDRASVRILSELGVRLDDESLLDLALRHGARRGRANDVICLPEGMLRELVARAPHRIKLADRMGRVLELGPGCGSTFWTGAALNYARGTQCHPITGRDLTEFVRLADGFDTIFAVTGTSIAEILPSCRDIVGLRIMTQHTRKHLRNVKPMIEIAQVLAGSTRLQDQPLISFGYSCLSPLHWARTATDLWRESAGWQLPLMVNGEPVAGATSPVTLAGSLALSNAEILAGIALIQLLEPGRPVVHNLGFAHVTDMRTGSCLSGSAECALLAAAGAQLARFYGLPCASWMGTDAFTDDPQASLEKALTAYAHVKAGVNTIWGMGQLESQKTLSPVQLAIDHEIAQWLLRMQRGFPIDNESLAYDVIREVTEEHGDFLSHEHTLSHFRAELSESALLTRTNRERWLADGARTLVEKAVVRIREILEQPCPGYLTEEQDREIAKIEKRALEAAGQQ
ncbi:MAG: trimethylamine methyltransferase family protein [Kiritimatiellia bacterium]